MTQINFTDDQIQAAIGTALRDHSGVDLNKSRLPATWWKHQIDFMRAILNALPDKENQ